jgi:tetratricopeptide (TPR) repeat protein
VRRSLALCLALLAPAALAQSAEVKKYVNTAITLYENLEYEKALKQLKLARAKSTGADDDARVSLLEGIVLADMGREEKALTAFKTGFSVDVEAKLPLEVSPKVQAVAEKARANVRKLLAPQLEAQRAEEQRKAAEEARLLAEREAQQRREAELKRQEDEERARNQPPPMVVKAAEGPSLRALSVIPGAVGLAAAGVATGLLISASGKHAALVNGTAQPSEAAQLRDSGRTEATLGYVFTGVAVAGVGAALVLFLAGAPKAGPTVAVAPLEGGGLATVAVPLDLGGSR